MSERGRAAPADVDLVVATRGRTTELAALVESLAAQENVSVRLIVVDQNDDDRLAEVLKPAGTGLAVLHVKAPPGVSRARNEGQRHVTANLVAWPDDDCVYPPSVLERVVAAFRASPHLDVLVGRIRDPSGAASVIDPPEAPLDLDWRSVWRYPSAPAFFARSSAARAVGEWNEELGPASGTQWDSGEDSEWLVRAVRKGLHVRYEPQVTVVHADPFISGSGEASRRARRYGRGTIHVALLQGYGAGFAARLLVRALGGALVALGRGRRELAAIHLAAFIGRAEGLVRSFRQRRRSA